MSKSKKIDVDIKEEVNLESGYNYDFYFEVDKNNNIIYLSYGMQAGIEEKTILYKPDLAMVVILTNGFTIDIPKNATSKPTVIGFKVNRSQNEGTLYIVPEISFLKPLILEVDIFPNQSFGSITTASKKDKNLKNAEKTIVDEPVVFIKNQRLAPQSSGFKAKNSTSYTYTYQIKNGGLISVEYPKNYK